MDNRVEELKSLVLNSHPKYKDSPLSIDALLDAVIAVFDDCKAYAGSDKNTTISRFLQKFGSVVSNLRQLRTNRDDFNLIKRLAKGQFGEVSLVRGKHDNKVYAMKILRKHEMLKQADIAFYMEEKQIMASIDSKWITSLVASFQDDNNLYLVMEYLPGGDLATLMMKADEGHITIDENFTRFYIAETVVALQELHKMNFIHRDVKPGNLLLDAKGHIRLADFGSCIQVDEKTGVTSQVTVGTPDYISPEVLQANEGKGAYGKECDFWSAGITLYEMLFGDTPFYAESLAETYHQIMNHQEFFQFPEDVKASSEVMDLMKRLICDRTKRLKTAEEILAHPFFKNMNWQNLQNQTAPFVPKLTSDDDVSNFAEYEDDLDEVQEAKKGVTFGSSKKEFNGNNLSFIGYTFSRNASLIKMLQNKEGSTNDSSVALKKRPSSSFVSEGGWEAKLVAAESELEKLKVRLANETKKIVSLETTQASLEKELSDAKKLSNADKRALEAKQDEISRIEREKKVVQLELDSVKRKHADEIEEKTSLESKLAKITASLDSEKQSSIAAKEQERLALAEKKRLENSLKDANDRVHTQGEKLAVLEKEIVQLNKAKALLEVEVNQLKQANEEASATIAELQANILQLESKISHQEGAKEYAADALSESEKVISELKAALEVAKSQVSRELSEKDQLRKQISFIETQKSAVERELSSVKEKLPSPTSDKPSFFSGKGSSDASKQLEAEIEAKKKLSNQFSAVSQEKTQLEFRLNDAQAKLQDAEREMKNLKTTIKSYEERLAANRKSGSIVRGLVGNKMESSGSEMDLSKISDDQKTKLEKKIADLQKSSALATVEIADLKKKLETETSLKSQLETKVADLEKSVREENALKAKFEAKVNELQTAQATMQKDLQNAKADTKKVMVIKASQEAILADHTKNIALLEMARDELQSKLQVATNSKKDLEQEVEKLKTRLSEQIVNQIDPSEFAQLADECNRIHKEYLDLTGKYDSLKSKYDTVLAENESWKKRNELDTMKITDLTRKVSVMVSSDYLDEQSAPSMVPGFAGTMQRARMNISKMKNMEQKLTTEMARRAALETELQTVKTSKVQLEHEVEELRKQLQQTSFERPGSHLSHSTSARSSTVDGPYSFKKLRPLLFPDHPEQPVLQGWIRMRVSKGTAKKAKFEWTKKFAVVRNSKIYLYDKEKEKDNADIKPLLDLRCDFFLVRAVKPKELIHLTVKEVSCVFTIQAVLGGFSSFVSLDNISSATGEKEAEALQQKLQVVIKSIEKEEKFKEASERMAQVSSGDNKKRIQGELDECSRRIKVLRQEKAELEKALEVMDVEFFASESPAASLDDLSINDISAKSQDISSEIEKKEALLKGVENMLSVTKNQDARSTLAAQHEVVAKDLHTLKESLGSLDNLAASSTSVTAKAKNKNSVTYEHGGHVFRPREHLSSVTCFQCHDALFGKQSLECVHCHLICHKFCYSLVTLNCDEHIQIKRATKYYFMAVDEMDRNRWVAGLDLVRANLKDESKLSQSAGDIDSLLRDA